MALTIFDVCIVLSTVMCIYRTNHVGILVVPLRSKLSIGCIWPITADLEIKFSSFTLPHYVRKMIETNSIESLNCDAMKLCFK